MSYPPEITFGTFEDLLGALRNSRVKGQDIPSQGAIGCPLKQEEENNEVETCKLTLLKISAEGKESESFQDRGHAPLPAAGRFCLAPNVDVATIAWELEKPELVTGGALSLFSATHEVAIWTKELDAEGIAALRIENWKGEVEGASDVSFPNGFLTVEHAPYKLHLSIEGPTEEGFAEAWTYFDVAVASIALEWGPTEVIPDERGDEVTEHWKPKITEWQDEILAELSTQGTDADQTIYLKSDLFTTALDQQSRNDYGYRAYRDQWGSGPLIPLIARVKVWSASGDEVNSPEALGYAQFLWDWEDRDDDKSDLWTDTETAPNKALLADALDYRVALEANNGWAPEGSTNCHYHHGGKRGEGADPIFPEVVTINYAPETNAAIDGQFPFKVFTCSHRQWAATSRARTISGKYLAGCTGTLFQPSRMAGDSYRVSVYYLDGRDFPYDQKGADLRNTIPTPHATTGLFEVQRKITCKLVKKHGSVPDCDETAVKSAFTAGGIKVDFENLGTVVQGTWDASLSAAAAAHRDVLKDWWPTMLIPSQVGPNAVEFHPVAQANDKADQQAALLEADGCVELVLQGVGYYTSDLGDAIVRTAGGGASTIVGRKMEIPAGTPLLVKSEGVGWLAGDAIKVRDKRLGGAEITGTVVSVEAADRAKIDSYVVESIQKVGVNQLTMMAKNIQDFIQDEYIHRIAPDPLGAYMFLYKDKCPESGEKAASGAASSKTASEKHANVYTCYNTDKIGVDPIKGFSDVIVHELGHTLFLPHAAPTQENACHIVNDDYGGKRMQDCVMNYEPETGRFCGLCLLRLRGWAIYGKAGDDANTEAQLVQMTGDPVGNSMHFKLDNLRAQVPVTPPNTVRAQHASDDTNEPDPPAPFTPEDSSTDNFDANPPLVLLSGGIAAGKTLELEVDVVEKEAGHQVVWTVERDLGDSGGVIGESENPLPILTIDAGDRKKATLTTNATGAFHVKVSVNTAGGTAWVESPKALRLNLVLVKVKREAADHTITGRHCGISKVTSGGLNDIMLHTQKDKKEGFDYGDKVPLHLKTTVQLIGGGDGTVGLDKVFGGWVNNILKDRSRAVYRYRARPYDEKYGILYYLRRTPAATWEYLKPALDPEHPIHDGTGQRLSNWGGGKPCLSTSKPKTAASTSGDDAATGRQITFEVLDAPMTAWDRYYPTTPPSEDYRIREISMHTEFRCYLCFWTTQHPVSFDFPADGPGARLYSVVEEVGWQVGGRYTCTTRGKKKTIEALDVTNMDNQTHATAVPAETTGLELYPPSGKAVSRPRKFPGPIDEPWG